MDPLARSLRLAESLHEGDRVVFLRTSIRPPYFTVSKGSTAVVTGIDVARRIVVVQLDTPVSIASQRFISGQHTPEHQSVENRIISWSGQNFERLAEEIDVLGDDTVQRFRMLELNPTEASEEISAEDAAVLLDAFEEGRPDVERLLEVAIYGDHDPTRIWVGFPRVFDLAMLALKQKRRKLAKQMIDWAKKRWNFSHVPKALQDFYYTGIYTIDDLATLLKLPAYEKVNEQSLDFIAETARVRFQYDHLDEDGNPLPPDYDESAYLEVESEVEDEEVFRPWHAAVMAAATALFAEHRLRLAPKGRVPKGALPYQYEIRPDPSLDGTWTTAARAIMETINGVGYFTYNNVRDFLDSGPYTPKGAVLSHLGWVREYPRVYGTPSAERIYERNFRR